MYLYDRPCLHPCAHKVAEVEVVFDTGNEEWGVMVRLRERTDEYREGKALWVTHSRLSSH